jgi:hypothetical protein
MYDDTSKKVLFQSPSFEANTFRLRTHVVERANIVWVAKESTSLGAIENQLLAFYI